MRISSLGYILACVSLGAGIAHSSAIPNEVKDEVPTYSIRSVDSVDSTDSTDAALRRIDFKITRGGLEAARDVILVASGATSAIAAVVGWVQRDSSANSCAPIGGSGQSDKGEQKYHFKYWVTTTGKNCDTTAQTKTVAAALDDAWDQVHKYKYNWACIDLSHGGTWHGHLAVATVGSGKNVDTMCN
ncbi:hypothetical protein BDV36DRAFT_301248 [Aspergillus pseudocaelatus]|nr:hypothetical protein BDV36DRAFT_301248 [Aspergillus pseudocaelatus]